MTDKKPKTREEIMADIRENARKTLEYKFFQDVLGSNQVKRNPFLYGQLGVQGGEATYGAVMGGDEVQKARKALYDKARAKGDALGVFGEPAITNYEVSTDIIEQIEENKRRLCLGDLGEVVKGVVPGLEFSVPEELRNYIPQELYQKVMIARASENEIKDVLSEQEMDALIVYDRVLSQAYNRGAALRAAQSGYFADINQVAKEISEKYKKPEKEK